MGSAPGTACGSDAPLTPHPQWLGATAAVQVLSASLAALVGGVLLVLWIVMPSVVSTNPVQMQWNAAFCVLVLAGSMLAVRTRPVLAAVLAVPALVVAASAFVANTRGVSGAIEHLVPASVPATVEPGHMGTAPALLSIGLGVLPLLNVLYVKRPSALVKWTISVVTGAVVMAVISLFGAQVFSLVEITVRSTSEHGFRQGNFGYGAILISWVCVWVLEGQWRPLLSEGISATALRWLTVVAIALPIIPGTLLTFAAANGWLEPIAIVSLMAGFVSAGGLAVAARVFCALRTLEGALIEQALVDELTGLWNLGAFRRLAEQQFADARRHGDEITIVVFDLDGLKVVNDTYGHAAGSEMIRAMARIISDPAAWPYVSFTTLRPSRSNTTIVISSPWRRASANCCSASRRKAPRFHRPVSSSTSACSIKAPSRVRSAQKTRAATASPPAETKPAMRLTMAIGSSHPFAAAKVSSVPGMIGRAIATTVSHRRAVAEMPSLSSGRHWPSSTQTQTQEMRIAPYPKLP